MIFESYFFIIQVFLVVLNYRGETYLITICDKKIDSRNKPKILNNILMIYRNTDNDNNEENITYFIKSCLHIFSSAVLMQVE